MNIYVILEDGESFCIRAATMAAAVKHCEEQYIIEALRADCSIKNDEDEARERRFYHDQILESCVLIGELKN